VCSPTMCMSFRRTKTCRSLEASFTCMNLSLHVGHGRP
jgi:hypothetical protein